MIKLRSFGKYLAGFYLISALAGCATMLNQKPEQHFSDQTVTTMVKAALANEPTLRRYIINVKTIKGEVLLEGQVDSLNDVYKAAEVVNRVDGVKSLYNGLDVK